MTGSEEDPTLCPLCRQVNQCGMAGGTGTCWCFDSPIPPEVLALVPGEVAGKACVCRECALRPPPPTSQLTKVCDFIRKWR